MEIFAVLFLILKIVGVVLIAVFLLFLVLVAILIWGNVRYDVYAEKADSFNAQANVSFIGIFKFIFLYENEKSEYYLKVLWFKFFFGNHKKNIYEKNNNEKFETAEKESAETEKNRVVSETIEKTENGEVLNEHKKVKVKIKKTKRKSEKKKKKNNNYNKGKNIYDKILHVKNYPDRDIIVKYTITFIKDLFESIKPKYFEANALIGFDDPFYTGCFLGAASVVSVFLPFDINVQGEFNKKIFEGNLKAKGKTNVFKIGIPVLKYILKKPIFKIIRQTLI